VEASTECRVLIRGRGSIKDPAKVLMIFPPQAHLQSFELEENCEEEIFYHEINDQIIFAGTYR
jgi:hypothetical protein